MDGGKLMLDSHQLGKAGLFVELLFSGHRRHLVKQAHIHQRQVSARKKPLPSTREPYFGPVELRDRPPDLFNKGMAMI